MLFHTGIPAGGRAIQAQWDASSLRLSATPAPDDGCHLEGQFGTDRVDIDIRHDSEGRTISGHTPGGDVDLVMRPSPTQGSPMVTGTVAGQPVFLEEKPWSPSETSIQGYVGDQRVRVTRHHQFDGNVLTGFLGSHRLLLREREVPGDGPSLEPLDYLAVLPSAEPSSRVG